MPTVEIEWHKTEDTTGKYAKVMCRLVGTEYVKEFGPMPAYMADSFIKAKREALSRNMSRAQAIKIFSDPKRRL